MNFVSAVAVHATRRFDASAGRVFDAWLEPAMLGRWMFGPDVRDEEIVRLDADARIGGSFSFVVLRDGAQIDHIGEYLQIERPHRLVFTWAAVDEGASSDAVETSRVNIAIMPRADGCELAQTHEMDLKWADYAALTQAGWSTMLEALARHLSRQS